MRANTTEDYRMKHIDILQIYQGIVISIQRGASFIMLIQLFLPFDIYNTSILVFTYHEYDDYHIASVRSLLL